jgi:hypothetical protein
MSRVTLSASLVLLVLLLVASPAVVGAFQGPVYHTMIKPAAMTTRMMPVLFAKKKGMPTSAKTGGQGFGSVPPAPAPASSSSSKQDSDSSTAASGGLLQSVESGGSDAVPTFAQSSSSVSSSTDRSVPVGDRTKKILAEQYGLRTLEDQRREEKLLEQRRKFERLKEEAERNDDFDLMAVLPAPLILVIDRFLKAGLAICVILFVAAGAGITAEAWSIASKSPLPEDIDSFIVNVIEPNFTPGLLVLLGFSVSLGLFASAQLGSSGSVYTEDP